MSEEEKEKVSDYLNGNDRNSLMLNMIIIKCVVCVTFVRGYFATVCEAIAEKLSNDF